MAVALVLTVLNILSISRNEFSRGCTDPKYTPKNGRTEEIMIEVNDSAAGLINRTFRVYTPINYDQFQPFPLVVDFHGYYDNSSVQEEQTGWKLIADKYNIVVVWPNGLDDTIGKLFGTDLQAFSWNAAGTTASPGPLGITCNWTKSPSNHYPCHATCMQVRGCRNLFDAGGCDSTTCSNDELYTELFLNWMEDAYCLDLDRVHVTGMSNGAMMTYDLVTASAKIAPRIASIVPFSGSLLVGFNNPPLRRMAVMDVHGIEDDVIPANVSNGHGKGPHDSILSEDGFYYTSTADVMKAWATKNGCSGAKEHYPTEFDGDTDLYCWSPYGACPEAPVIQCTHSLGHTWPFINTTIGRSHAALLAWNFFAKNPRIDESKYLTDKVNSTEQ
eukprot:m.335996 g.335996  ORF g.335996 m.335996 type:complete len:387 (-) comp17730_c0_seq1:1385-2545(-)